MDWHICMKKILPIDMPIIQLPNLWITVSDAYISKLEENIVGYISTIYWCDKAKWTKHVSKIKQ